MALDAPSGIGRGRPGVNIVVPVIGIAVPRRQFLPNASTSQCENSTTGLTMSSCCGERRTGRSLDPLLAVVGAVLHFLDLAQGRGAKVDFKIAAHSSPYFGQKLANLSSWALPCGDSFLSENTTPGSSKNKCQLLSKIAAMGVPVRTQKEES